MAQESSKHLGLYTRQAKLSCKDSVSRTCVFLSNWLKTIFKLQAPVTLTFERNSVPKNKTVPLHKIPSICKVLRSPELLDENDFQTSCPYSIDLRRSGPVNSSLHPNMMLILPTKYLFSVAMRLKSFVYIRTDRSTQISQAICLHFFEICGIINSEYYFN